MKKHQNKPPEFLTESFVYDILSYKIQELQLQWHLKKILKVGTVSTRQEILIHNGIRAMFGSTAFNGKLSKQQWELIGIAFADFCENPTMPSNEKLDKMNNDLRIYINNLKQ